MLSYQGFKCGLSGNIDFAQALKARNNKLIWKWCRQHTLISPEEHKRWSDSLLTAPHKMYSIRDVITEQQVGVCGLTDINRLNQRAEFSIYIDAEYQQKGYGKHALLTLLRHAFHDHNLHCIWGETYDGNPARKMFEQLGMACEGTLRQRYYRDGRWIDSHVYSILRDEFSRMAPNFFGDLRPVGEPDPGHVLVGTRADIERLSERAWVRVNDQAKKAYGLFPGGIEYKIQGEEDAENYSAFGESGG